MLLLVLFSSQKKRISSHHILAFNQQKNNLERKHFTNWTHTLFIVSEIVLHKASPFLKPFPILYKNILMQVINLSLNIQLFWNSKQSHQKLSLLIFNLNIEHLVLIQTAVIMCSYTPYMDLANILCHYALSYVKKYNQCRTCLFLNNVL